jgi:hypothetical protein
MTNFFILSAGGTPPESKDLAGASEERCLFQMTTGWREQSFTVFQLDPSTPAEYRLRSG